MRRVLCGWPALVGWRFLCVCAFDGFLLWVRIAYACPATASLCNYQATQGSFDPGPLSDTATVRCEVPQLVQQRVGGRALAAITLHHGGVKVIPARPVQGILAHLFLRTHFGCGPCGTLNVRVSGYKETQWLGMHKAAGTRAGNAHQALPCLAAENSAPPPNKSTTPRALHIAPREPACNHGTTTPVA